MDMIEEIQSFISKCPIMDGNVPEIDYLGSDSDSIAVEVIPCEPVLKRYYTGGSLRQYCFNLALRRCYAMTPGENLKNEQLCEELADWAEECSQNAQLPTLATGQTAQRLEVISGGYMQGEQQNFARYKIGFRLIYTQI